MPHLRTLLPLALLGLVVADGRAQTLIRDLGVGTSQFERVREVRGIESLGNHLMLTVEQEGSGGEPWWSDGTPLGTRMLMDIAPGAASSWPGEAAVFGNRLLFFATDTMRSLWITDGTVGGTTRLGGPFSASGTTSPIPVGNAAFFLNGSSQLWRTDGTAAGTLRVATTPFPSEGLCRVGSRLFFRAQQYDLWTSDGTTAGTALVQSFQPVPLPTPPPDPIGTIVEVNGRALFVVDDGLGGQQLWSSDGSTAGTYQLLAPGTLVGIDDELVALQGRAWFSADDGVHGFEPWSTDGTAAGTSLLVDLHPGTASSRPGRLFAAPTMGRLFFSAGDWQPTVNRELYVTDGTANGTQMVDLGPGGNTSDPEALGEGCGGVFFAHYTPGSGREPWFSAGTTASTWPLGDLEPGSASSLAYTERLVPFGNEVAFLAVDASTQRAFASDGTAANTRALPPLTPPAQLSARPVHLTDVDGSLWFHVTANTGYGGELWASDGTSASTRMLWSFAGSQPGTFLIDLLAWNGTVIGSANSNLGSFRPLLRFDAAGTPTVLRDFNQQNEAPPFYLRSTPELVFFIGHTAAGREPWCTDGTAAGTRMILDVHPGGSSCSMTGADRFVTFGDRVVFVADDGVHGGEPWITDGTAAGTFLLADIRPGTADSSVGAFCDMGSYLLFAANDGVHGSELWRTDGTPAGTVMVADIHPNGWFWASSNPAQITRSGDIALFSAFSYNDIDLWRTDGTPAGTVLVFDLPNGVPNGVPGPDQFVAIRDRVLFRAFVPDQDRQLWVSDGTNAGTHLLADPRPGYGNGVDVLMAAGTSHAVFAGSSPDRGSEVWISDGSAAGTMLLADIVPGPASSMPWWFQQAGGRLYWQAFHPDSGWELHGLPFEAFGGAMWEQYGNGCGAAQGTPVAAITGDPLVGSGGVSWRLQRGAPNALCLLLLGLDRNDVPLGNSCRLLVGGANVCTFGLTDGAGTAAFAMPLPNNPSLAGLHLWGQFAVFEAGGPLAGLGTSSPGLHLLIGR